MPTNLFWGKVAEVTGKDWERDLRALGMGRPSCTNPGATHLVGGGDRASPGSMRQCANLTFGFMTLFLCSKCHGKCQAEAEAGEGPIEEAGGVPRGSGQGGAPGHSPPPRSPLGLPLAFLSPASCPQSAPASHCDLVEMLPLFTCCQGPDGAGSGTCQQSPLQGWAAVGSACAVSACCVTLGSTHPLLVTRGLIRNPGLLTDSVPSWVGKHSKSQTCGVPGSGGSGDELCTEPTGVGGWLVASCGSSRHTVGTSSLSEDWGTGSQDCVEAFAHSSLRTGLMLLWEGWPLFLPTPWTGVGWAAGGFATYPLGMASSPEPPPIPKDVA